jgi:hypothetical protein
MACGLIPFLIGVLCVITEFYQNNEVRTLTQVLMHSWAFEVDCHRVITRSLERHWKVTPTFISAGNSGLDISLASLHAGRTAGGEHETKVRDTSLRVGQAKMKTSDQTGIAVG